MSTDDLQQLENANSRKEEPTPQGTAFAANLSKVAVTGGSGFIGQLALKRLLLMPEVHEVHVFDIRPPAQLHSNRLFFHRLDLTKEMADSQLAEILAERGVKLLIHAALFIDQGRFSSSRREVESIGTFHVLNAAAEARIERLIVLSSTFVYGADAANPNFLKETSPLPRSGPGYLMTRVDVEHQVADFAKSYPKVKCLTLRFATILGPNAEHSLAQYFLSGLVPKILGYDPLLQFLHEEDASRAVLLALHSDQSGVFNIVGRGILPLSTGFHICGRLAFPVPSLGMESTFNLGHFLRLWKISGSMAPLFQYPWLADGTRAKEELGFEAEFSSRQALKSMVEANRLRRVGFSAPSFGLGEERPDTQQHGFERVF